MTAIDIDALTDEQKAIRSEGAKKSYQKHKKGVKRRTQQSSRRN